MAGIDRIADPDWMQKLATDRQRLRVQLLARKETNDGSSATAVCRLYYRPRLLQPWSVDLSESLIQWGRATVSDDLYHTDSEKEKVVDTTDDMKDLRRDVEYMNRLGRAELDAAGAYRGVWADSVYRDTRPDVVDEVDFQVQAPWYKKLWRYIRGG